MAFNIQHRISIRCRSFSSTFLGGGGMVILDGIWWYNMFRYLNLIRLLLCCHSTLKTIVGYSIMRAPLCECKYIFYHIFMVCVYVCVCARQWSMVWCIAYSDLVIIRWPYNQKQFGQQTINKIAVLGHSQTISGSFSNSQIMLCQR